MWRYVFIEEHDWGLIKPTECYVIIAKLGYDTRVILSTDRTLGLHDQ